MEVLFVSASYHLWLIIFCFIFIMLKLSNQSNQSNNYQDKYNSKFVDRFAVSDAAKPKLPRHISTLESLGHAKANNSQLKVNNKCSLSSDTEVEKALDLAVNILRYQLEDSSRQKHLSNLHRNLQNRLAVAIATKNEELVELLQQEFQQLEDDRITI